MNFSPPLLPYGKFCHRADAVNATAQKIALRANGNPQKSINFVHWSGGCGMNEISAQFLTLRVAQFRFYDNASPTGMRDRSKVSETVPAQGTLETKHFEKKTTTPANARNAQAFAEPIMRYNFIDGFLKLKQSHQLTHTTHRLSQS